MPDAGEQRRLREFSRYSRNLKVYFPAIDGVFVCPVCLKPFCEADVLHHSLRVSIGHVFPKETGCKLSTLECCDCNARLNRAGDNELVRLHKQWDAMGVDSNADPIKGFIEMPSGRVGIDVSGRGIHAHFRHASPAAFNEARRALIDRTPLDLTLPAVHQGKLNIGILHSAHLLLFHYFGYGYLFTPAGKYIRNYLNTSEQLDNPPFMIVEIPRSGEVDGRIIYRAGIYTLNRGGRCLFVALPVADPNLLCQLVLLPGLWNEDIESHRRICGLGERWLEAQCSTLDPGPRERLCAPEYADCLQLLWRGWRNDVIDRAKLMYAIRAQASDSTVRKVDAAIIGRRFGIVGAYLAECIGSLANDRFLQRTPKRNRRHLVRLTAKAITRRSIDSRSKGTAGARIPKRTVTNSVHRVESP